MHSLLLDSASPLFWQWHAESWETLIFGRDLMAQCLEMVARANLTCIGWVNGFSRKVAGWVCTLYVDTKDWELITEVKHSHYFVWWHSPRHLLSQSWIVVYHQVFKFVDSDAENEGDSKEQFFNSAIWVLRISQETEESPYRTRMLHSKSSTGPSHQTLSISDWDIKQWQSITFNNSLAI